MITSKREINGKISIQHKFYIMDTEISAEEFANVTRNHWQIENSFHWILDVHFKKIGVKERKEI